MSNQYVTVMTPWGFFPVSDVYSVIPKWEESHAVTADVIYDDDAPNYYALVCDLGATEAHFTITMMDTTDPDNPVPPAETAEVASEVWQMEGWQETRPLESTLVLNEEGVWGGDIKTVISLDTRQWIGLHQCAKFMLDVILPTEPDRPYRMAYGTMSVRR
ncbi:MAG TPA: hypothetical protein VFP27_02620 [Mycobacterium sp.]|nr:hypothetical protein [Mycobacterium sp.]